MKLNIIIELFLEMIKPPKMIKKTEWEKEFDEKWGRYFVSGIVLSDKKKIKDFIKKELKKERQGVIKEIESSFIQEFCNDHNADKDGNGIRWLRGIAYDMPDLLEQILNFFNQIERKR